jgi:hypothetical protein
MAYSPSDRLADGSISRVAVQSSDVPNLRRAIPAGSRMLLLLARLSFTLVATFLCLPALLMTVRSRVPVNPRGYPLEPHSYLVEPPKHEQEWDPDDQIER